jgi:hypothetical protein
MYCYFSVHFDNILENRKLRSLLNLKKSKRYTPCLFQSIFFKRITLKTPQLKLIFHLHSYTQILVRH